ncbi:PQQ-binding-like beta-propeller repeat protein [Paenibacillus sp. p3-SID867]|uniref:outer membrane protein assembly factor BamB family protein n=1 Tax=Paenibacillus sp. p3-SID867 TaxID=2916363 RepID=UPI0021A75E34|nr:PQQ-binding-like beta-propeller repeat protein [Paenibacillus sp. p3-SID867]MCT1400258.1 PQQ-binding-like beta-propeller repeat protein [Paenibacillus sp. p3-SID867]
MVSVSLRVSIRKRLFIGITAAVCISLVGIPAQRTQESAHVVFADAAGAGSFTSGQRVTLQQKAALFPKALSKNSNLTNLKVSYYGAKGERLRLTSVKGELAFIQSDSRGDLWLPTWYVSKEAAQVKEISPLSLQLRSSGSIYLAPGSAMKWPVSQTGTSLIAVAQWKDWYGVMVAPSKWKEDYRIYRPAMMWVQGKDTTAKKAMPEALLGGDSGVPTDVVRNLTEFLFKKGTPSSYVKKLLGEPQVRETSRNQEMSSNKPMILGETWRYEQRDAHYTVTFSPSGKLTSSEWVIPWAGSLERSYSPGDDYEFTYRFAAVPPQKTIEAVPDWRNQGNLNFTFLLEASEDVLLLKGDDGGYSGMHDNSSLYAIDRSTGKKLWQEDAGFGWYTAVTDKEREHVTMYSAYNPEVKDYAARVRHIRLSDGKVKWEVKPKNEFGLTMTAAADAIILDEALNMNETKNDSVLSVLDQETGKLRWKKTLSGEHRLLNAGSGDPYVLVEQNGQLTAYDPVTGKAAWNVKVGKRAMDDPTQDPYFIGGYRYSPVSPADMTTRWMLLGKEWVLLNTETGAREAVYPAREMERFEVLNERYLLVQRALNGEYFSGATAYESVLYDSLEDKELWTVKGRAAHGDIEGERVYLALNGIPAAIDIESGSILWKMETTSKAGGDLSHLVGSSYGILDSYLLLSLGSDLVVLNKEDGRSLGRLHNVVTGSVDLREVYTKNGALNVTEREVLVGTVNGAFIRYDARALKERLDEL